MDSPKPSRLTGGKKFVCILAQGNPDVTMFTDIYPKLEYFFGRYGFDDRVLIRVCGVHGPGEVETRTDIMKLAQETAARMCRSC